MRFCSFFANQQDFSNALSTIEMAEKLYAGLQRFDTTGEWWAAEGGKVVEVDCASMAVTRSWDVGANTNVVEWPDS